MESPPPATEPSATEQDWPALLTAARSGNAVALGMVCERMRDYLLLVAAAGLDKETNAKLAPSDIVQQSFLEVQRDIARFQGNSEVEFRNWLARLVQHNLLDANRHYRQTRRRDATREVPYSAERLASREPSASSLMIRVETDEQLARAVDQLPPRRRRLIELRHRQGMSFAEIGREMAISESAARQLWVRSVESLRSLLSDQQHGKPSRRTH